MSHSSSFFSMGNDKASSNTTISVRALWLSCTYRQDVLVGVDGEFGLAELTPATLGLCEPVTRHLHAHTTGSWSDERQDSRAQEQKSTSSQQYGARQAKFCSS